MKVGILTFHRALNYGAVLQCYALQSSLEKLGVEVEVIDYENAFISKFYSPFYIEKMNPRKFAYMLYAFRSKIKRNRVFSQYRKKYLKLSKSTYTEDTIKKSDTEYDVIIVGSDQVWNLEQTQGDLNYLLQFAETANRVSYAASIGIEKLPESQYKDFERELKKFAAISVREKSSVKIVRDVAKKDAVVSLDPTLLLSKKEWEAVAEPSAPIAHEKYICVYKINSSKAYEYAAYLSKKTGLKVIAIKPDRTCPKAFQKELYASPNDFLSYIRNATYVVTDSFHGTVFSILYEKQFIACLDSRKNNKNTRIVELLEMVGLKECLIDSSEKIMDAIENDNDYVEVKKKIDVGQKESIRYLKDAINL